MHVLTCDIELEKIYVLIREFHIYIHIALLCLCIYIQSIESKSVTYSGEMGILNRWKREIKNTYIREEQKEIAEREWEDALVYPSVTYFPSIPQYLTNPHTAN